MASRQGSFRARTGAAFICVHLRHLRIRPRYERVASMFRSPRDLIIRRWTQIYADGFATRLVQSKNGWPLLSAYICVICGFVLGTNGSHQCSFAARPDHPQMDADLRRWLRDKVRSARERGPLLSA